MKTLQKLVIFQALSSVISGLLISKMSLLGKVGISLFFKEYQIFKSFWQTALLFLVIQFLVIGVFLILTKTVKKVTNFSIVAIMLVLLGLGATIYDFQTETSHRLLNGYFHSGFYLFWVSVLVSIFWILLAKNRNHQVQSTHLSNK